MGQLLENRLIINEVGNVFLVQSGSTTSGFSQSLSISDVFNVSMSSNVGNLHTPPAASSSYFIVSGSNLLNTSYNVYFQSTGSTPVYNIKMAPNSSSAEGGYGSLGGSYFAVSHSNQTSYFYYANPESRTKATSSLIDIVGLHSSSNANTDSQYAFFISGSGGTVYKLCATSSLSYNTDYSSYGSSPVIIPFEYHAVSMSLEEATGSGGIEAILGPEPISAGVARMVYAINENKSTIGASVTASFSSSVITGITFNAISDEVDSRMSFFTQSLQSGSTADLKQFVFSAATHTTSSAPIVASTDSVYSIPLAFTSSEWNVMTASRNTIHAAYPPYPNPQGAGFGFLSASLSGSEESPGGLFIDSHLIGQQPNIANSGLSESLFEFKMSRSGSNISIPPDTGYGAQNVEIVVGEFDTPTLVTETVTQLNAYFLGISRVPPTRVRGYGYLSGSIIDNSNFTITMPPHKISGSAAEIFRTVSPNAGTVYAREVTSSQTQIGIGTEIGGNFSEGDAPSGSSEVLMSFQFDPTDRKSAVVSGSAGQMFYMSGSGDRMGFNTTKPTSDIDLRADEFQVRSKASPTGVRVNKEGNIESFNSDAAAAATGSEFILNYSRGSAIDQRNMNKIFGAGEFGSDEEAIVAFASFDEKTQAEVLDKMAHAGLVASAEVGDVLGSIRWVAESGSTDFGSREVVDSRDSRVAGEAARIEVVVNSSDDTGITSDMIFKLALSPESAPQQVLRLDSGTSIADATHELTGSLHITHRIDIGRDLAVSDDTAIGGDLEVTGTITSTGNINANGNIVGDGATQLSGLTHITAIGNMALGNHSSDAHTITGATSHVGDISVTGDITASAAITTVSASISKLEVSDINIVGRRHILFNAGIYINDNPLLVDNGYFGSSLANTPSNWNDPTPAAFDSSAGTFESVIDITEDEHGSKIFHAPFAVSRIEVLSSWRTAGTGDDEAFWCGIWTGSAGERLGATSGAHSTVKNIGLVTGSIQTFDNGGNWEGHNNDLDFTFSTPLPAFTQIYYGMGTGEASSVGTKNIRGHITMMVYEA